MPQNFARDPSWPSWYTPEDDETTAPPLVTVTPMRSAAGSPAVPAAAAAPAQQLPTWLTSNRQYDPEPAPSQTAVQAKSALPAWLTSDPQYAPAAPQPSASSGNGALPAWYTPEAPDVDTPPPDTRAQDWADTGRNAATGVARIPGAVLGAPNAVAQASDWLNANAINLASRVFGGHTNVTPQQVDAYNPVRLFLPHLSSNDVDKGVFDAASAVAGRPVTPYEPTSIGGQLGQAAITAGGAGLVDPAAEAGIIPRLVTAAKTALAGAAAQGTHQVFPNSDVLPVVAALLTHGGVNTATRTLAPVAADVGRQIFTPTRAGLRDAAQTLASVDNSLSAVAQPTATDLYGAQANVGSATDAIGPGLTPWAAGTQLREGLQDRYDALDQAREDATAPIRVARDQSTNTVDTQPVLDTIADKLKTAAGAQADALTGAYSDLQLPSGQVRTQANELAASRQAINARIGAATRAGDNATAAHLLDVRSALDAQLNDAVPEAGAYTQTFADMSRPLDPLQYGPVAKTLDRDQFNSRYTLQDERVPDLFLRSPATRSDLNQLVGAFGGDRDAALGALEQHLAGVAQTAVNPDGTLDADAFGRAMQPYNKAMQGNVGMFFPELAQKFATARAAQSTLDTMQAQRALADSVGSGGLRDANGAVTAQSFGKFMDMNKAQLSATQSPGAVMRLLQIRNALGAPQGQLADALKTEIFPAALGYAAGGLEGGVLGSLLHKTAGVMFNGLDARRQAAFNQAIERATLDPDYAQQLTTEMGKRRGLSPARALVQSVYATIPASLAGTGGVQ